MQTLGTIPKNRAMILTTFLASSSIRSASACETSLGISFGYRGTQVLMRQPEDLDFKLSELQVLTSGLTPSLNFVMQAAKAFCNTIKPMEALYIMKLLVS